MGMFDEVIVDADLPNFPLSCRRFQTKSLERLLDLYVITRTGRLCLAGNTFGEDEPGTLPPESEMVDMEFHGDLLLTPVTGPYEQQVARFTHGTFEWVRPYDPAGHAARWERMTRRRGPI